eukprot:Polyplicarium_translucidae@DN3371_c1_g1_i12.p1
MDQDELPSDALAPERLDDAVANHRLNVLCQLAGLTPQNVPHKSELRNMKRRFLQEVENMEYSGMNRTSIDMLRIRAELKKQIEETEYHIEDMEHQYTEANGPGSLSLIRGWDVGGTTGQGGSQTSNVASASSAAKLLPVSQSKRQSEFLRRLSAQQEKRKEHPFTLTSCTSRAHKELATLFAPDPPVEMPMLNYPAAVYRPRKAELRLKLPKQPVAVAAPPTLKFPTPAKLVEGGAVPVAPAASAREIPPPS